MRQNIGLYQGERVDNKEWIRGPLLIDSGKYFICEKVSDVSFVDNGNRRRIGCWYEVFPQSVGEYTGFKDKRGKKIFEGHILVAHHDDSFPEDETITEVIWHENRWSTRQKGYLPDDLDSADEKSQEIIGTMFDDPELLFGKDKIK